MTTPEGTTVKETGAGYCPPAREGFGASVDGLSIETGFRLSGGLSLRPFRPQRAIFVAGF